MKIQNNIGHSTLIFINFNWILLACKRFLFSAFNLFYHKAKKMSKHFYDDKKWFGNWYVLCSKFFYRFSNVKWFFSIPTFRIVDRDTKSRIYFFANDHLKATLIVQQ